MIRQPPGTYRRDRYYRVVVDESQREAFYQLFCRVPASVMGGGPSLDSDHRVIPGQFHIAFTISEEDAVLTEVEALLRKDRIIRWTP